MKRNMMKSKLLFVLKILFVSVIVTSFTYESKHRKTPKT